MSEEVVDIVRLGAGSFATIYVWQSRNNLAMKVVADPKRGLELRQEFEFHQKVYAIGKKGSGTIFRVPRPVEYHASFEELVKKHLQMNPADSLPKLPPVYTMQRVWPVPPVLAASIRAKYFPANQAGYMRPFIARIYLGRSPERSKQLRQSRFFNANNFPLDALRCEELELSVTLLAQDMGKLLARIHYCSELDGRDIEFALGGDEVNSFTEYGFSCFDFNQCRPHDNNVEKLVSSFFDNDPYYPRPGMPYWEDFKQCYLKEALLKGEDALKMAQSFVEKVEIVVATKAVKQVPEDRGNEMALLEESKMEPLSPSVAQLTY